MVMSPNLYRDMPYRLNLSILQVFLKGGYTYIPSSELVSLVSNCFRLELSKALAKTARMFPVIEEQERLLPMLNHINEWYLGEDYGNKKSRNGAEVSADMVDKVYF